MGNYNNIIYDCLMSFLNTKKMFDTFKGAICRHCFVYIKPFNFVNSQNDVDAISSYPVIGLHGATAKEVI